MKYEPVIGLEVHAQMLTESKLFCGCSTRFGAPPNSQTCPICLGMPGVLPVLNRRVVEFGIRVALATHGTVAPQCRFARKNYFYPDLPKGYQISQYEQPLSDGGTVDIVVDGAMRRIGLVRVHMEEDAGKNLHEGIDGASHVDLNRTGVPLLEIVSQPDLRSPEEAVAYLKKLRDILVYLGVNDGNMDEGSFRCDANVSLRPRGSEALGTRAEVKNINSFKFVQKAIAYEIGRQEKILDEGGRVVQETRLWNPQTGTTESMRSKEEAHDYRYFPEPDLVPVAVDAAWIEQVRENLAELPDAKRARFAETFGLSEYEADVLTSSRELADYYEACAALYPKGKTVANWVMGDLLGELNREGKTIAECAVRPAQLAAMLRLIDEGMISGKIAKTVFAEMFKTGRDPDVIVSESGLVQVSDDAAILEVIDKVLGANPGPVSDYRGGKDKLFGFFVGQVMKVSGGKANPAKVNELLQKRLSGA